MNVELYNDDCLEKMKDIQPESIDLILADLPFNITHNKWDSLIAFQSLWEQFERIITPPGAIVLFSAQPFTAKLLLSNLKLFRYEWIWVKQQGVGFLNAHQMPLKIHENILVFSKSKITPNAKNKMLYNPQFIYGEPYRKSLRRTTKEQRCYGSFGEWASESKDGKRFPVDVIKFSHDKKVKGINHPTQKPVALLEYLIKTYTNEGMTVLDPVMGSGSTGVACINTNRNFIGIEKEEEYFKIAQDRLDNIT